MKNIVITGSTRGIGFGLADAFLARGCRVMISGRKAEVVQQSVAELAQKYSKDTVYGNACDVTAYDQVQTLWAAAKSLFGTVDIWINNAGQGNTLTNFWELTPEKMKVVVRHQRPGDHVRHESRADRHDRAGSWDCL